MKQEQTWRARIASRRRIEPAHLDLVVIRRRPQFRARLHDGRVPKEPAPQRLQVGARYPPRGGIGKFASAVHEEKREYEQGRGVSAPFHYTNVARMDVQIFGARKNAETRKALRFFAERRMKTHFVDLQERAASRGELTRFAQRFGVAALVDAESRRFSELGLRTARYGDERWLEILVDEPLMLRMPLVRHGHALTVGAAETTWKSWLAK